MDISAPKERLFAIFCNYDGIYKLNYMSRRCREFITLSGSLQDFWYPIVEVACLAEGADVAELEEETNDFYEGFW